MAIKTQNRVIFLQVSSPQEKIHAICKEAATHFEKRHRLIYFVDSKESELFIDKLLWTHPPLSFLPHEATLKPSQELIVITQSQDNLNEAGALFNLRKEPLAFLPPLITTLYELEDMTSPAKQQASKHKFEFYKSHKYHIISH